MPLLTAVFFPTMTGLRIGRVWHERHALHLAAAPTRRTGRCPLCRRRSTRIHARYPRTIADLPCTGTPVVVHLRARRFVCRNPCCHRHIFTERLPDLVAPWGRRTTRQRRVLEQTGFALGGASGARYAHATALPVSRRTLLRLVRAAPPPFRGVVHVLGVDDGAPRHGRTYGTILVDLETHDVIDLLPDRTAATRATWLHAHPEITTLSRDRGGAYAEGARQGAPQAVQVADRFHLLKNVTDSFERFLRRNHAAVRRAVTAPDTRPATREDARAAPEENPVVCPPPLTPQHACEADDRRERRQARYDEVRALRAHGLSIRAVARTTGMSKVTVRRYIAANGFPEAQPRGPRRTLLTPFIPFLEEQWAAGCHTAKHLWQALQARGFTGGYTIVSAFLHTWRATSTPRTGEGAPCSRSARTAPTSYTARQTVRLLLGAEATRSSADKAYLQRLGQTCPLVTLACALVQDFHRLRQTRDVDGLYPWLHSVEGCPIPELRRLATGLWRDRQAIENAVALPWSNGQVEGCVNRLKMLKRSMFGRATFDLLRLRVLHSM